MPALEPGAADVEVECDVDRLVMIVEHVIRNAQDATPESGSVSLSVGLGASASAEPGSRVDSTADTGETSLLLRVPHALLAVSDTGSGMTREFIQEQLFRPFDTTKGSKGMGIGAYQVREYVQSLGGRVVVDSRESEGTRIELHLPAQTANSPAESSHAP